MQKNTEVKKILERRSRKIFIGSFAIRNLKHELLSLRRIHLHSVDIKETKLHETQRKDKVLRLKMSTSNLKCIRAVSLI